MAVAGAAVMAVEDRAGEGWVAVRVAATEVVATAAEALAEAGWAAAAMAARVAAAETPRCNRRGMVPWRLRRSRCPRSAPRLVAPARLRVE